MGLCVIHLLPAFCQEPVFLRHLLKASLEIQLLFQMWMQIALLQCWGGIEKCPAHSRGRRWTCIYLGNEALHHFCCSLNWEYIVPSCCLMFCAGFTLYLSVWLLLLWCLISGFNLKLCLWYLIGKRYHCDQMDRKIICTQQMNSSQGAGGWGGLFVF